ncbi:MAG: arylsulfatase [Chlorobi bacterium]|nr:arylsulfatase [Chlorobiota bacterium]
MKKILLFTLFFVVIFFAGCEYGINKPEKPNIVIILADDMGIGDLQCYNQSSKISTPNIDRLASEGMKFTDAHSASAVCTPTRYSLLTGRYCWRTRLKKGVLWPWDEPLIEGNRLTIAEMLRQQGYRTALIGKWHLGWNWPVKDSISPGKNNGAGVDYSKPITGGPLDHGFDYYFGDDVPNFPPYTFIENRKVTIVPTVVKPDSLFGHKGMMAPGWKLQNVMPSITKRAVRYIADESKDIKTPFFLFFSLTAPHTPIAPDDRFKGKSIVGPYGDYVQEVDFVVGEIMEALKKNGLEKNTLLVFTSDNGSPARNGKDWSGPIGSVVSEYGHNPSGIYRGFKGDVWEGGHREPFIIKWPGVVKPGSVSDALITSMDIMPTVAGILDVNIPAGNTEDAHSFEGILTGKTDKAREYLINHSLKGVFAIRKGKWKLILSDRSGGFSDIVNPKGFGIETPGQLYDLEKDPGEKNNLWKEYPEIVKELKKKLRNIQERE